MHRAGMSAERANVERGLALPGEWYADPVFFALEKERIFARSWQYAGVTQQIPNPGDYVTCRLGHIPVVVTRGRDGVINAMVNVCRHRGHEVATEPQGSRKTLQCRYHGWTYELDGALRSAPRYEDEPGVDHSELCLTPLRVATLGPFIFVNPDSDAPPLEDVFGTWFGLVGETGVDLEATLKPHFRREYVLESNWKVTVDNFLECYHCGLNHPGLKEMFDVSQDYWFEEHEYFSMQGPRSSKPRAGNGANVGVEGFTGHFSFLWPNLIVSLLPDGVTINTILPLGTERSMHVRQFCFADWVTEPERVEFIEFMDTVVAEDLPLCASVQRGLGSGFYRPGPLLSDWEPSLRHFQRLVHGALAEGRNSGGRTDQLAQNASAYPMLDR